MAFSNNVREIDISKVTIENPVHLDNGGRSCLITYNGAPLKVQVPVGLVTGFHPKGDIFHTDGSGRAYADADGCFRCVMGFNGCDPYGKERSTTDYDASSVYNFVLSLQDRIVNHCVENGVKLFGKNRSEGVIRENLLCIHTFIKKDNGNYVQSGEGRPSIRPTISYSEMERHGDVKMAYREQGLVDGTGHVFVAVVSPTINHREFYMIPHLLLIQNKVHVAWKLGYLSEV